MMRYMVFGVIWGMAGSVLSQASAFSVFPDIGGHERQESIQYLADQGIVQGYPDGTFGPDRSVTRAELLKIVLGPALAKLRLDPRAYQDCFPDVSDERFSLPVCYAQELGIVQGYPDGSFQPNKTVTLAEALKIAYKGLSYLLPEQPSAAWFQPYVDAAHDMSIYSRYEVDPDLLMTRAEIVYVIHRLLLDGIEGKTVFPTDPRQSLGCLQDDPPRNSLDTFQVDGRDRNTITVVGDRYRHDRPSYLILAFHGRTNSNAQVRQYYDIEKTWDEEGIIVYPSGLPENSSPRSWSDGGDRANNLRDLALFDTIVADISRAYCIDKERIYVMGHSLGAWFSNSLACMRGDVVRASGTVGGGIARGTCLGPTASLVMHHPEDRLAPFSSGVGARDWLLANNSCNESTSPTGPSGGNCREYVCDEETVVWCPHSDSTAYNGRYYPHTWPDFAEDLIRDFFEENSD